MSPAPNPQWAGWIVASYRVEVGGDLGRAADLDAAPFVVLCHDLSPDPLFVYANTAAARLWERPVAEIVGSPSRLSAPPEQRAARAAALARNVVVRDYGGLRVSATGRLFTISGAILWPVTDSTGELVGQAATFSRWRHLEAP